MNYIKDIRSSIEKKLDEKNVINDSLKQLEKKTNVPTIYLLFGFGAFIALYLMVGYGATFLANFIGFLYPAYASIKAIESSNKDDDTKWLTYWVVYAAFSLVEFFADILLFWIPLYAFMKCIFLIFLMFPGSMNGATMLYDKAIKPAMDKYGSKIDQALDEAGQFTAQAKKKAGEMVVEHMTKAE